MSMKTYEVATVSPYQLPFRLAAAGVVAILLGVCVISVIDPDNLSDSIRHTIAMVGLLTMLPGVLGCAILGALESEWKLKRSLGVAVSENKLIQKRDGAAAVELPFDQIKSISRFRGYLTIGGTQPDQRILVPREIVGYEDFARELAAHGHAEPTRAKSLSRLFVITGLVCVACLALFISHNSPVILISGVSLLLFQAFGLYAAIRSAQTGVLSKHLLVMYFVCASITVFVIYARLRL